MRFKKFLIVAVIPLFAVSCGLPFSSNSDKVGGVFKTTNGGSDWTEINQTITQTTNRRGKVTTTTATELKTADVRNLEFLPKSTDKLLAGGGRKGLFLSENAGENWKNILTGLNVYSVAVDPENADRFYAGGTLGNVGQILMTEDGGKTWQAVYIDTGNRSTVGSIAVHENGKLIAAATSLGTVMISKDSGASWTLVYQLQGSVSQVGWMGQDLYILHSRQGLFLAVNGQGDLVDVSKPLLDTKSNIASQFNVQTPAVLKPNDFFQFTFKPSARNQIYLATDTGVFRTVDNGNTWQPVTLPIQTTTGVGKTNAVKFTQNPEKLLAAVGGNLHTSSNDGASWEVKSVVSGGVIRYILPEPDQSKTVYLGVERLR